MPRFRRYFLANHSIFITCVTNKRRPYLQGKDHLRLFWDVLRNVKEIHQFNLHSYVILPDHFHWIMELPENEVDFPSVMHSVKNNFTRLLKQQMGIPNSISDPVWHKRFWDHIIRNEKDFQQIFDYIHWNPIKHGYVEKPEDWAHSSFNLWLKKGIYPEKWGWDGQPETMNDIEYE